MPSQTTYGTLQTRQALRTSERKYGSIVGAILTGLWWLLLFVVIVIFACIFYYTMALTCLGPFNPPFGAPKDWSDFKNQSFAVGFDLTAGYGTAAIAFVNGTIVDVARAEGTPEYNNVLARLALESSAHPTPPYYNCRTQTGDLGRQWRHYFRKRLGLPVSTDVAALTDILSKLKEQTNSFLGALGPLQLVFVTIPSLPALYLEEMVDAADYAKVQLLTLPNSLHRSGDQAQWPVSELNTAFAGNGFGLHGLDSMQIHAQSYDTNSEDIGNNPPTRGQKSHASAPGFYAAAGIANFSLGLSSCHGACSNYWSDLRLGIRAGIDSYHRGRLLGRVISYGESVHKEIFDSILREEVLTAQTSDDPEKQPEFSSFDPVFAAARGAAEFARYRPKLPSYLSCFPDLTPKQQGW